MPRILLVEDDPDLRFIVEHVLVDVGHTVDATGTMTQGIELIRRHQYDLVLADGKLPDGTGMDICDIAAEKGITRILITGYAFTLPAGVAERYEILLKPLHPVEIVMAVDRALSRHRQEAAWPSDPGANSSSSHLGS